MRSALNIAIGLVLLGSACGGDDGGGGNVDASTPDGNNTTTPDATAADARKPSGNACDRVDIVFSVDASSTMREEVKQLADTVFPDLITRLRDLAGGTEDYRVAVLDACPVRADFHTIRESVDSDNLAGDPCNFASGERWMTTDSAVLEAEFSCVANIYIDDYVRVGDGGVVGVDCTSDNDDEQPAKTILASLSVDFSGDGQPNEGFLRDDALLLMVGITNEDETPLDEPDGENAYVQSLYDDLVAIKGDVNKMVFLGIGGSAECVDATNYGAERHARRLEKLSNLFGTAQRGLFWDMCQSDLAAGLTEAMKVIEATCNQVQ